MVKKTILKKVDEMINEIKEIKKLLLEIKENQKQFQYERDNAHRLTIY